MEIMHLKDVYKQYILFVASPKFHTKGIFFLS